MKPFSSLYFLLAIVFFCSCEVEYADFEGTSYAHLTSIGVVNWTGHWRNCSPGETLIFSVSANNRTQEFTLSKDSSTSFLEEFEEGDLIRIVVMKPNRDVIHARSKNYEPSNPERSSPEGNKSPFIRVCDINTLDLFGF